MAFVEQVKVVDTAGTNKLGVNSNNEAKVNVADGSDAALGATTDAAVDTDTTGTVSGKLRGIVKLIVNLLTRWPAALGAGGGLKIDGSGIALPVSGTVAVTGAGDATAANQTNGAQKTQISNGSIEADVQTLGTQVTSSSKGLVTHSVVHGSPDAGVTYYDAMVKASGELHVHDADTYTVLGTPTDAQVQGDVDGTVNARLRGISLYIKDLYNQATNYLAVKIIGSLPSLSAGSAIIGQVGIDQTTPGTTNKVSIGTDGTVAIGSAIPAGTNLIGKTGIDQTTDGTTNKVRAASTENESYGSNNTLTITNLNSLASSSTAGWQSARIDNTSTKAADYFINVKLDMANTAPANDKAVYIYICAHYYDGTTWYTSSGGTATLPSGSEGTYTIASPNNLRLLGVLAYTTADMVLQDTFLLSNVFGANIPDGFSIIIINFSGAAIAASGNIVQYKTVQKQQV